MAPPSQHMLPWLQWQRNQVLNTTYQFSNVSPKEFLVTWSHTPLATLAIRPCSIAKTDRNYSFPSIQEGEENQKYWRPLVFTTISISHMPTIWSWASFLTFSLSLSSLFCKVGKALSHKFVVKSNWDKAPKVFCTVSGISVQEMVGTITTLAWIAQFPLA